ncbi:hypothetical protein BKA70DRAFT_1437452 [Coprinopsis sp. MPI-PUGE-AT-0042]|nr:hypothetical protein BKA70DRAFT_1437452 [Coprinopsis sp. MPI-PUGE-AT-0042]
MALSLRLAARRLVPLDERVYLLFFSPPSQHRRISRPQMTSKPVSASEPLTLKLSEDSFRAYRCDLPSLKDQATKDELWQMYRGMQTM